MDAPLELTRAELLPSPLGSSPASEASRSGGEAPRVAVITGTQPRLASETEALLRTRLRAVTLIFLLGFTMFFARNLVARTWFEHGIGRWTWLAHTVLLLYLSASFALLAGDRKLSLGQLRRLELTTFGLIAAFLAILHYRAVVRNGYQGEPLEVLALVKNLIIYSFMLMVVYGLYIPNTWRRAARVVALLGATPVLVAIVLRSRHPEVYRLAPQFLSFELISDHLIIMLIGAGIAIYGTHLINSLRSEVYEARQLGQYRLRRRLGSGGMGEVFLADHLMLKRPCAIKLIAPHARATRGALARFEREVRSTAKLSHPNTIEIYDYGHTDGGTFYYVMEYLPGLNLGTLVERHGPLPAGRVIYLLRQACDALAEAHAAGLVHRDIKPANLYASKRGGRFDFMKVLDFGLVKAVDGSDAALSQDRGIVGSPQFMSPEQAGGGGEPDLRTDLYALGGVAYYLLTGRPPFEADTPLQVIVAHARDPVDPPSKYRPDVPPDLEAVVLRCLAKSPADRFPDAGSLGNALAGCAAATQWDADRARAWWAEWEPLATGPPSDDESDTQVESSAETTILLASPLAG